MRKLIFGLFLCLGMAIVAQGGVPITVVNPGFEDPDWGAQVNGFDGEYSNHPDVPGWEDDYANYPNKPRSGIITRNQSSHTGHYCGFLVDQAADAENIVWQLTDQTISSGEVYTFSVWAWEQWSGANFKMSLFYDDGLGNHTEVASATHSVPSDSTWRNYSVEFTVDDVPAAIGKKLGIALKHIQQQAGTNRWMSYDDVQLEVERVLVHSPGPANEATDIPVVTNITWSLDDCVDYCDVYFGTDSNVTDNPKVVDGQTQGKVEIYNPTSNLSPDTTYYWRVDVTVGGSEYIGSVWSFTTSGESAVLDNFDDYEDNADFLLSWSGNPGAAISLDELLSIMEFTYDCTSSPWQCAAQKTLASPQDWDNNAWAALQINFRGDENNDPETMFITLSDGSNTATVTNSDPYTATNCQWQVWDVGLAQFSNAGVDLSNVTSFAIGFGDSVAPGGTGTMYFNDILLYHERCLPEMGPVGDLNADCFVGMQDLVIFLDDWLNSDYSVTASAPQSGNLCAHYEFNETTGTTASDSSANNYDAPIEPDTVTDIWDHSGHNGGCIVLDNRFEVILPAGVFSGITNEVTIAFRVNGDSDDYSDPVDSVEFTAGPVPIENHTWDRLVWGIDQADSYGGCWNHYAIVKNAGAGTIRLYLNGLLVARHIEAPEVMNGSLSEQIYLALIPGYDLQVKIDDLCVYNYALSQGEVLYLAAGAGSELIQPLEPVLTNSDLTNDGTINLADFAMITQDWLKQQFWP